MCKKLALFLIYITGVSLAYGQDIPLFTQKLSNPFIYNPSFAGQDHGSVSLVYMSSWQNVKGHPTTYFANFHTPLADQQLGLGFSLIQENVNIIQSTYFSTAFAYHMELGEYQSLSFGLSGEINFAQLNNIAQEEIANDPLLSNFGNQFTPDVSFGLSYTDKYFRLGASFNRMNSALITRSAPLSYYYSGYAQLMIPLFYRKDFLEPMVSYHNLAQNSLFDFGLYYTLRQLFIFGVSFRTDLLGNEFGSQNLWRYSLGLALKDRYVLAYSYESQQSAFTNPLAPTSEITLRMDLQKKGYAYRYASNFQKTKMSMTSRRKTLAKYNSRPPSFKNSQKGQKRYKKGLFMNPNRKLNKARKAKMRKIEKRKKQRMRRMRGRRR